MHVIDSRARSSEVSSLDRMFAILAGGVRPTEHALRDQVLSLLLRWRAGILAGSACSLALYLTAAVRLEAAWAVIWIILDIVVSAARWWVVKDRRLTTPVRRARAVGWLMVLGFVWALLLGLASAFSFVSGDVMLMVLAAGAMAASTSVMTFRNAPTPRLAKLMILTVMLPPIAACVVLVGGPFMILGLFLLPWCIALFVMVQQNFEVICTAARIKLKLHMVARVDALTGLRNRLAFNEQIVALADGRHDSAQIVYMDLDGFKLVNDHYGHEMGDVLLASVAQRFRGAVRVGDQLFRLGGDEFAVIMYEIAPEHAETAIQRLIKSVRRQFDLGAGISTHVGVSVGSARWSGEMAGTSDVLRAADAALYQAKERGRGRHVMAA